MKKNESNFTKANLEEIFMQAKEKTNEEQKINKTSQFTNQSKVFGDMRSPEVKSGNFIKYYFGKNYLMDTFVGIVLKVTKTSNEPNRAWVLIELQEGKRLGFFTYIDDYIQEGSMIEAVGICKKPNADIDFYEFRCLGGYRRILTQEEIEQLIRNVKFYDLKIHKIPFEILSFVKESKVINM